MDRSLLHDIRNELAVAVASVQAFIDGKLPSTAENLAAVLEALEECDALVGQVPRSAANPGEQTLLGAVVEGAPYAKFVIDAQGRIALVNAQAEKLFGYGRDEMIGNTIEMLVPERFRYGHPELRAAFNASPIARPMGVGRDLYGRRKNGSEVPIEIGLNPIETATGKYTLAAITDVTERKRAEELRLFHAGLQLHAAEVEELNLELARASQFKSQFVATMSHELRTPLNAIVGAAELLARAKLDERAHVHVQTIAESADALLSLIGSILDFSKIEAGRMDLQDVPFEAEPVLGGVGEVLAQLAADKGIALHVYVDPSIPPLRGDAVRLRQILLNLIGNAVKFTERGQVVARVLLLSDDADAIVLRFEVQDTGIGIETEAVRRLFEPFVQIDASATRRFGGTGLGLSISKRLVELMGGEIGVESEPGSGSTFWFTARFEHAGDAEPAQNRTLEGVAALIVSGDDPSAHIIAQYMASWRIETVRASSGAEVLKKLGSTGKPTWIAIVDEDDVGGRHMNEAIGVVRSSFPARVIAVGKDARIRKPIRQSYLFDAIVRASDPRAPSQAVAPVAPSATPRENDLPVLVAEDNVRLQRLLKLQFDELGIPVEFASDGREAVEAVRRGAYSMVFMDCQMPDVDGLTASKMIRQEELGTERHIPITAMTANAFAEDRAACSAAGMDDYLAKPVKLADLRAAIERWAKPTVSL